MANRWAKAHIKLEQSAYLVRRWCVDLDAHRKETGHDITPADLFDPHLWANVRTRVLHDRSGFLGGLREGDIVRVVKHEGSDAFDIDLVVRSALPGALIMELKGARTPWDRLRDAQKRRKRRGERRS